MTTTASRRTFLRIGCGTAAALGTNAFAGEPTVGRARAQSLPVRSVPNDYEEDYFYREDWLGEPWQTPQTAVLIHGAEESSTEWYAWVPRMAQEYRLIRPDLPGTGHSKIPLRFGYSLQALAEFVTKVMDKAGVDSAHIIGAKTGGAVAMRFAADFPTRTRSLVVVGGPASSFQIQNPSPIPQRDRLGSSASREMVEYWNQLFKEAQTRHGDGVKGLREAMSNFDLAREGVLQRISAPTLIVTADRTKMHSVEKARAYQIQIPNSRLIVIRSDAYHIAAADADACVTHTLAFLKEVANRH